MKTLKHQWSGMAGVSKLHLVGSHQEPRLRGGEGHTIGGGVLLPPNKHVSSGSVELTPQLIELSMDPSEGQAVGFLSSVKTFDCAAGKPWKKHLFYFFYIYKKGREKKKLCYNLKLSTDVNRPSC